MSRTRTLPACSTLQSLEAFIKAKTRAVCEVCKLPAPVRAQLGPAAAKRGYSRADQVEWLQTVVGAKQITPDLLAQHFNQRHDQAVES